MMSERKGKGHLFNVGTGRKVLKGGNHSWRGIDCGGLSLRRGTKTSTRVCESWKIGSFSSEKHNKCGQSGEKGSITVLRKREQNKVP